MTNNTTVEAPLIGFNRHRMGIDGNGVTTLVAFHGCPLRCRYCLNPQCNRASGIGQVLTPESLLDQVKIDNLYFLSTDGGICFGGGEPCLRSQFISKFCQLADPRWRITLETSLNVKRCHLQTLLPLVSQWIIDVKDMNPDIYHAYTRRSNRRVKGNLRWLAKQGVADKCIIRLPLIPDYNTKAAVVNSRHILKEMGFTQFDEFEYIVEE